MDIKGLEANMSINDMVMRIIILQSHINVIRDILIEKGIIENDEVYLQAVSQESVKIFQELFSQSGDIDWNNLLNKKT